MWVFGRGFLPVTLVSGGLDTGWTFYTPYTTDTATRSPAVAGAFILGSARSSPGINFIATIHSLRPRG